MKKSLKRVFKNICIDKSFFKVSFSTMVPNSVFVKKLGEKNVIFFFYRIKISVSIVISVEIVIALIFGRFIYFYQISPI